MTNTNALLNDVVKYVLSLKDQKKFPSKKTLKKNLRDTLEKHSDLFVKKSTVTLPDTRTTGFRLMCLHKEASIRSSSPVVINKAHMKLLCSFLWGRNSDKMKSKEFKELVSKLGNLEKITDDDRRDFMKKARKHNKQFKTEKKSSSPTKNPYLVFCQKTRPTLAKLSGVENKDYMKLFGYMWTGKFKAGTEQRLKDLVKKNKSKIKPLSAADKKKFM